MELLSNAQLPRRRLSSHGTHRAPAPMPLAVPPKSMGARTGHLHRRRRLSTHGTYRARRRRSCRCHGKRPWGTRRAASPAASAVLAREAQGAGAKADGSPARKYGRTHRAPSPAPSAVRARDAQGAFVLRESVVEARAEARSSDGEPVLSVPGKQEDLSFAGRGETSQCCGAAAPPEECGQSSARHQKP